HERGPDVPDEETEEDDIDPRAYGEYGCFNAARIERVQGANFSATVQPVAVLQRTLEKEHEFAEVLPTTPRAHALKVLNTAPMVAEKRSRQVVPLFMSWAQHDEEDTAHLEPESDSSDMPAHGEYIP